MIDTEQGEAKILHFLPTVLLPAETLEQLSGNRALAKAGQESSGLAQRVARAWTVPLRDISCAQVRVLIGQRLGLEWLASATAQFVAAFPDAECDLYPGDLTTNALRAWRDLLRYAPDETERMLMSNFDWLVDEVAGDCCDELKQEALLGLADARITLNITG